MGIRFACPNGHRLNVKSFLGGKRGICPDCGARFTIPKQTVPGFEKTERTTSPKDAPAENGARQLPVSDGSHVPSAIPVAKPATSADAPTAWTERDPVQHELQPAAAPPATANPVQSNLPTSLSVPPATETDNQSAEWYVQIADGQRFGPADTKDMRDWILEGRIAPDNLVHQRGWPMWKTAAEVFPELSEATPASRNGSSPELLVDGPSRTDKYRGRQAAKSRLLAIVATLGIMSVVLLATLIYVVRR